MVAINMSLNHKKILGKKLVYMLKVLLGCQRILNSKGAQALAKMRSKKK
jgi:hypothetical protein